MNREHPLYFSGGRVLVEDAFVDTSVLVADGQIFALGSDRPAGVREVELAGACLLPGMVDVHGDAFERQISPRPGVRFPLDLAMAETDRQLAANGITTAYHGLTLSWEPGLRSVEAGAAFLLALDGLRQDFAVDHRIQLRWESFAFEAVELVKTWLASPLRPALAFNDHTTGMLRKFAGGEVPKKAGEWAARAELPLEDYHRLVLSLAERESNVPAALEDLAATARLQGATLLSHDDRSREERQRFREFGATVAEFPLVEEAAADARLNSEHVVLGAPNVVRGGSHIGALDAATAIGADLCTVLASDYYYPSMLKAAELLARGVGLAAVWPLVSRCPAEAMGLNDRGEIAVGKRADLVVVGVENRKLSLRETYSAGVRVWQGGRGFVAAVAAE